MKTIRCRTANLLYQLSFTLLIILFSSSPSHASKIKQYWQSNDQFVALEHQDSLSTGPAEPNDHPAKLTKDRLTSFLTALTISTTDSDKPEPLFTKSAVQTITPYLLQGLSEASPNEDVTFAVIGLHDTLYGLAKAPKVTTGRVFYKTGQFNIIIGLAQQEVRDREDRRLFPFTPGSRQKALKGEWKILPQSGQKGYRLERNDWVVFNDEWQPPVVGHNLPAAPAAPTQMVMPSNDTRTPAERLTILKELREKGLISEDEYQGKRVQILDGL